MLARTVINTAGHAAPAILNSQLTEDRRIGMYFAKGSYASYRGPGAAVSRLLYPVPDSGGGAGGDKEGDIKKKSKEGFASLGTHLTLDLEGGVRFGPDLEWLDPGVDEGGGGGGGEGGVDFWMEGGEFGGKGGEGWRDG